MAWYRKISDVQSEIVTVQVRDKGSHVVRSDWIGEVSLKVKDFKVLN
jgi:hypothetical protein